MCAYDVGRRAVVRQKNYFSYDNSLFNLPKTKEQRAIAYHISEYSEKKFHKNVS